MNKKWISLYLSAVLFVCLIGNGFVSAATVTVYENDFQSQPQTEWALQGAVSDQNHAAYDSDNQAIDLTNKATYATKTAKLTLPSALTQDNTTIGLTVTPRNVNDIQHIRAKMKFYDSKNKIAHQIFLSADNAQNFAPTNTSSTALTAKKIALDFVTPIRIEMEFNFTGGGSARYRMAKQGEDYCEWSDFKSLQADSGAAQEISSIVFSNEYLDCNIQINDILITAPAPKYPPEAKNVTITGYTDAPKVGDVLRGSYEYYSAQGDAEGNTRIRWYRTDTAGGVTDVDAVSEGEASYTVTEADVGKYIWFEVLPVSTQEPANGTAARAMLSMRYAADIENDLEWLSVPSVVNDDITLPNIGPNGSAIEWKSDNTAVITDTGSVRPGNEDVTVTLTATVTNSGTSKSKSFSVLVSGKSVLDEEGKPKNLALNKDVIKATLIYNSPAALEQDGKPFMYINDGTTQTNMRSSYGATLDFTVDLGTMYNVNRIVMKEIQTSGDFAISGYTVEGSSDNVVYTSIINNGTTVGSNKIEDFPAVSLRYVRFTQTGTKFPAEGSAKGLPTILGEFEVYSIPYAPEIEGDVTVSGSNGNSESLREGETLIAVYEYSDKNGDPEQGSAYKWMRSDNENFDSFEVVGTGKTYKLTQADVWKYIKVEVIPRTTVAPTEGAGKTSGAVGFIRPSAEAQMPPVALNLKISGYPYSGRDLVGSYSYYDNHDNPEQDSVIRWSASDSKDGSYRVLKEGRSSEQGILTYTVSENEISKYIKFEVQPKSAAETGELAYVITSEISQDPAIEDLNRITLPASATSDIVLPLIGVNKSVISWHSSHPEVIGTDGTVKRQSAEVIVTLTATATLFEKNLQKTFTVRVPEAASKTGGGGGGGGGSASGGFAQTSGSVIKGDDSAFPNISDFSVPLFDDLDSALWAKEYIEGLARKEIITGTGNGNFEPNKGVTREELVKMIVKAFDFKSLGSQTSFADVSAGQWYTGYIDIAYGNGIIKGTSEEIFGVGQPVTREDLAVIVDRAIAVQALTLSAKQEKNSFADESEISDYAKAAVEHMQMFGIINGKDDNKFCPKQGATRAEVAKIIYLIMEGK